MHGRSALIAASFLAFPGTGSYRRICRALFGSASEKSRPSASRWTSQTYTLCSTPKRRSGSELTSHLRAFRLPNTRHSYLTDGLGGALLMCTKSCHLVFSTKSWPRNTSSLAADPHLFSRFPTSLHLRSNRVSPEPPFYSETTQACSRSCVVLLEATQRSAVGQSQELCDPAVLLATRIHSSTRALLAATRAVGRMMAP